jgi:prevent-host-death family protein
MKPIVVGIHEAKTNFSKLVKRVEAGDEVIVKSFDRPVAKLVPYAPAKADRKPGLLAGQITIKPGFDDLPPGFEMFSR